MDKRDKQTYSELLKDPRWQKKRLEILNRDGWTCQMCGAKDKTLHVHHLIYIQGKNPWEYEDCQLLTLCEDCHAQEHDDSRWLNDEVERLKHSGLTAFEIQKMFMQFHFSSLMNPFYLYDIRYKGKVEDINRKEAEIVYRLAMRRKQIKEKRKAQNDLH